MEYTETALVYGSAEGVELEGLLYQPVCEPPFSVVIDIHGGAWSSGRLESGRPYDEQLAAAGICVLAINFRQGPEYQHPAASADIAAAIRFAKSSLQYDTIGLVGSSSGGHLALHAGLLPNVPGPSTVVNREGADQESADVDFVVALTPVSNPIARYQYVLARERDGADSWGPNFTPDRLATGHRSYFGSQTAMAEASIQRIISAWEQQSLPRIFIVQAEHDLNVPQFMSETLYGACLDAGCDVRYQCYPDVAHGFVRLEGPQSEACIADMIDFIRAG
jgi:acetyl esterase